MKTYWCMRTPGLYPEDIMVVLPWQRAGLVYIINNKQANVGKGAPSSYQVPDSCWSSNHNRALPVSTDKCSSPQFRYWGDLLLYNFIAC